MSGTSRLVLNGPLNHQCRRHPLIFVRTKQVLLFVSRRTTGVGPVRGAWDSSLPAHNQNKILDPSFAFQIQKRFMFKVEISKGVGQRPDPGPAPPPIPRAKIGFLMQLIVAAVALAMGGGAQMRRCAVAGHRSHGLLSRRLNLWSNYMGRETSPTDVLT